MQGKRYLLVIALSLFIESPHAMSPAPDTTTTNSNRGAWTTTTTTQQPWLVVDFDSTCTEEDTTSLLPQLASAILEEDTDQRDERMALFKKLEDDYFDKHAIATDRIFSCPNLSLEEALQVWEDVSTEITTKVSMSRVLEGLHPVEPTKLASLLEENDEFRQRVRLRPNCVDVLAGAHEQGWNLGVLSISWCPSLIEAALVRHILRQTATVSCRIWSNAVDKDGVVRLHVPGAAAKQRRISDLKSPTSFVVFVGDSTTDLTGLLEADVGVLMGGTTSKSLVAVAERWGITLIPLVERRQRQEEAQNENDVVVWTTESWTEVEGLLKDLEHCSSSGSSPQCC